MNVVMAWSLLSFRPTCKPKRGESRWSLSTRYLANFMMLLFDLKCSMYHKGDNDHRNLFHDLMGDVQCDFEHGRCSAKEEEKSIVF